MQTYNKNHMIRYIFALAVNCALAYLFCEIDSNPDVVYTWYSGIWHGLFFVPNLVLSWFIDVIYKAECYTDAYNVFYWIFSILSTIIAIFGLLGMGRSKFSWRLNCKGAFARAAKQVKAQYPGEYNLMQPLFMANRLERVKWELWDEASRRSDIMQSFTIVEEEYKLALRKFCHLPHSNSVEDIDERIMDEMFKD